MLETLNEPAHARELAIQNVQLFQSLRFLFLRAIATCTAESSLTTCNPIAVNGKATNFGISFS
jgi:hypothetical protein